MAVKKDRKEKKTDGLKYIAEEILKEKDETYDEWIEDEHVKLIQSNREIVERLFGKSNKELDE